MKTCKTLLLLIFLLSCQTAIAQTVNSSITIKINGGNYAVSGVVSNDPVKSEVIEKIKARLGEKADFSRLIVQSNAVFFQADWQAELDAALLKIKSWKSGVFIFGNRKLTDKDYPALPEKIADAEIILDGGKQVSLKDYKNKVVVLFLFASWVAPGIRQAVEMNKFYQTISSRNVEIIGISVDDDLDEKRSFPKIFETYNLQYKLGWMDTKLFPQFVAISRLNGVPQAFVVFNGRLRGVFTGGAPMVQRKLEETILKILDEENL